MTVHHFFSLDINKRLASDWLEIQKTFQGDAALGQVVAVQPGLSDRHQGGHSVMTIIFASGLKLIYKPRDCGSEEAYNLLLTWLNERGISPRFKLLQVLNRSTHGWVEYVEHLPCTDNYAARQYYHRAGMLLCVLYALEGTDCHCENVIACGEHPVLIDTEMLLSHRVQDSGVADADAWYLASQQFVYSVLRTNFLPLWEVGLDGIVYDISGLCGVGGQQTPFLVQKWRYVNTDSMFLDSDSTTTQPSANVPYLDGVPLAVSDYIEELVDGFSQAYQFLTAHREALLAADSPSSRLVDQRVRFVFRATQTYKSLLEESLQPKYLRNGADRSITLDVLSKPLLRFDTKPLYWPIIAAEQQALAQLDIPLFVTHSCSADLTISTDQTLEHYFTEPSYSLIMARLRQLNNEDLEQQISFTRSSLYTRFAVEADRPSIHLASALNLNDVPPLGRDALVQQAVEIAQELRKRALRATDGSVTWIGMEYIPEAGRFQTKPMHHDLYDGNHGVALFLAALRKVTGDAGFVDLALGAVQPFRKILQNPDAESERQITKHCGIGGGKGLGSIVYTLVWMGRFLETPMLLEDAHSATSLITPASIAADGKFDIISGTAGAILGLLTLHQATADPAVLDGNLSLWLNGCGPHNRNSTESSNWVILPHDHAAPVLGLHHSLGKMDAISI